MKQTLINEINNKRIGLSFFRLIRLILAWNISLQTLRDRQFQFCPILQRQNMLSQSGTPKHSLKSLDCRTEMKLAQPSIISIRQRIYAITIVSTNCPPCASCVELLLSVFVCLLFFNWHSLFSFFSSYTPRRSLLHVWTDMLDLGVWKFFEWNTRTATNPLCWTVMHGRPTSGSGYAVRPYHAANAAARVKHPVGRSKLVV